MQIGIEQMGGTNDCMKQLQIVTSTVTVIFFTVAMWMMTMKILTVIAVMRVS